MRKNNSFICKSFNFNFAFLSLKILIRNLLILFTYMILPVLAEAQTVIDTDVAINDPFNNNHDVFDGNLDFHPAILNLCDGKKDIYIDIDISNVLIENGAVTTAEAGVMIDNSVQQVHTFALSDESSNGVVFLDQIPVNNQLKYYISFKNAKGVILIKKEISFDTNKENEKGIIDVSDNFNKLLNDFNDKNGKTKNIFTYFCGREVNEVELLVFFQDFLKLNKDQICDMIRIYNSTMGHGFGFSKDNKFINISDLCKTFTLWYEYYIKTRVNPDPTDCLCNMIRTKTSARNFGVERAYGSGEGCTDYDPKLRAENLDQKKDDGDLAYSFGRMGAAMAGAIEVSQDYNDSSPSDFGISMMYGNSTLQFRQVCVEPNYLSVDLSNCEKCKKSIKIKYKYSSATETYATSGSNYYLSDEERAAAAVEEWAMLVVKNGDDEPEVVASDGKTHKSECKEDGGDILTTILSQAGDIATTVTLAVNDPTATSIINAAVDVWKLIKDVSVYPTCNSMQVENSISLEGTDLEYVLTPGNLLQITLVSGAIFKAEVHDSGDAYAKLNSDCYIAGVLNTILDENGNVPDYCACELIGTYVWGSLESFTPETDFTLDENDEFENFIDWPTIFENAPLGTQWVTDDIGIYIGLGAEWGVAFDNDSPDGCCQVKIPCYSDCVFAIGNCNSNQPLVMGNKNNFGRSNNITIKNLPLKEYSIDNVKQGDELELISGENLILSEIKSDFDINLYPNPLSGNDLIKIKISESRKINSIVLYDNFGKKLKMISYPENSGKNTYELNIEQLISGNYFIEVVDDNDKHAVKQFIKI